MLLHILHQPLHLRLLHSQIAFDVTARNAKDGNRHEHHTYRGISKPLRTPLFFHIRKEDGRRVDKRRQQHHAVMCIRHAGHAERKQAHQHQNQAEPNRAVPQRSLPEHGKTARHENPCRSTRKEKFRKRMETFFRHMSTCLVRSILQVETNICVPTRLQRAIGGKPEQKRCNANKQPCQRPEERSPHVLLLPEQIEQHGVADRPGGNHIRAKHEHHREAEAEPKRIAHAKHALLEKAKKEIHRKRNPRQCIFFCEISLFEQTVRSTQRTNRHNKC